MGRAYLRRYSYDPYGELQSKTGAKDPTEDPMPDPNKEADDDAAGYSQDARDNPLRFQGFYYDSGVKLYDMQARAYRPQIGRFLTADRFESSQNDFELAADPLTQNRYAFAGGNPIDNVEFDGHEPQSSFVRSCDPTYGSSCGVRHEKERKVRLKEHDPKQMYAEAKKQWPNAGKRAKGKGGMVYRQPTPRVMREAHARMTRPYGKSGSEQQGEKLAEESNKPVPLDECAGCRNPMRTPEQEREYRAAINTFIRVWVGSSPLEALANVTPVGRGINMIRRIGGGIRGAARGRQAIPDDAIVVRGGESPIPPPGNVFSGAFGSSVPDAARGVPHGKVRATTAGEIRAGGGKVEHAPELDPKVGRTNQQHVHVCLGAGSCPFGDLMPNPVPKAERWGGPHYPYGQ